MNDIYEWSADCQYFYCDGYAWNYASKCVGKTEDIIKKHPLEVKRHRTYLKRIQLKASILLRQLNI